MNLKQIEYIVAIAEEKNISRAAQRLNITQSTLSQALLNVEKSMGMPLFVRSQRNLELTDAGNCYIKGAREILQIRKRVMAEIEALKPKDGLKYEIGISSQAGFDLFSSGYHRFQQCFPQVSIRVIEENAPELMQGILMGKYDMILAAVNSFEKIELPHQALRKEEIFLVAPQNYSGPLLSKHGNLNMNHVRQENFILANKGTTMRQTTDHLFSALGYHPNVICETGHTLALLRMVSRGIGFAILPETLHFEVENVRWIPFYPRFFRTQMAIYQEKYVNDTTLMSFVEMIKAQK